MNQLLEIENNQIIFSRAVAIKQKRFGFLNEDMIKQLRNCFLKPTWKIEAKYFERIRRNHELSQSELAERTNIKLSDLRKLENGIDFLNRDRIANKLKNYLQLQIN